MIVGLLGILKAGGAYVPLDPAYPAQRLSMMIEEAGISVVVLQGRLQSAVPEGKAELIKIDDDWQEISGQSGENLQHVAGGKNLAYVIYTSGSTGRPKGAMNTHEAITNRLLWMQKQYGLKEDDVVLQKTPYSFDVSVWEFFWPLMTGARLVMAEPGGHKDSRYLVKVIEEEKITTLHFVPSMLQVFLEEEGLERCESIRRVICSGEALGFELERRYYKKMGGELHNLYGPTEAAVDVTYWACEKESGKGKVPIGKPISNLRMHVLDKQKRLVPAGVPGELFIAGMGVGRGYLDRPDLTAERFIPNPFALEAGERLYKTGDVGRYLRDGSIEYLGREDQQVKIRGFRIELGEIEAALEEAGAREAAVIVREGEGGDKRLVGYVVMQEEGVKVADLKKALKEKLPEHMVPSAIVVMDELPLSANGKLDRKALPAPEGQVAGQEREYVAPRTPVEELLAGVWAQVLNVKRVGSNDDFFELGGHSLLATQVVSRVRQAFQVEVSLRTLFESTQLAQLALSIEKAMLDERGLQAPPMTAVSREQSIPLSFAQQRLWFLDQFAPGNAFYNIPAAVRIKGRVDIEALRMTFNEIVRRHESLRTTFDRAGEQAVQVIAESLTMTLDVEDLTRLPEADREAAAVRLATEEAQRPFDLSRGPLFRASLLKLDEDDHLLLATMHHIISDGWSIGVFIKELGVLYEAFSEGRPSPLPDLPIQYAEFAHWQRQWLQGEAQDKQLSYWANQLAGAPTVLDMPTDRPRPPVQTFRGSLHSIKLSESLSDALKALSRKEGATLFMTLLAAFKTLLYRYSGQQDILVGTPIANRNRAEIEGLIGFFANTLVMRGDLSGDVSFKDFLGRVREMSLEAYAHQDVPFEQLVEHLQPERDMSRSPLFQTMFVLQNAPGKALELPGLTFKTLDVDNGTAKFDLTLIMWDFENRLDAVFEYNSDLYDAATIKRLAGHFENLLEAIVAAPNQKLSALPLLAASERDEVLYGWNDTETSYGEFRPITSLIEAQVERTPDAIAATFDGQRLTYRELNSRANQVANYLQRLGVGPEVSVGISVERSLEMVVGVLGILKAGGVYVPIDPAYPVDRQAFMLEDTQAPIVLTLERLVEGLPETNARVVRLDTDWQEIAQASDGNPSSSVTGENLVYVVYTSGSTGRPKGVGWSHAALINMIDWMMQDSELRPGARTVQYASLSFDVSAQEIYPTLSTGNTLVLLKEEVRRDAEQLLKFLSDQKVERLFIPFVALQHFAEVSELRSEIELSLQEVITAGEQLQTTRHLRRLFEKLNACNLHNFYGPSEGNIVTVYKLQGPSDQWPVLPSIGKPIANTQVHVLDRNFNPVPVGVTGELYIAGVVLARGYLNRPDMTAEKFIPNPFSKEAGARMYKTGDVARYLADGNLEFLGRVDHQVKIRGFRVELGEVESVLAQHPAIKEAVVIAREDV
ncbi:MAG TPA: amino acid adenylation domain-containing protein, partial [Blastocatellia bacterium]